VNKVPIPIPFDETLILFQVVLTSPSPLKLSPPDKMLECIPADTDRQTWLNVAMAVHEFDYISNEKLGYSKFLEWSKTGGESFKGEGDVRTTWNSIKVSSNERL
jgi:hypothetical protein